ncbi:MAG: ABC transporter ATP-binding protein [Anaerolineaceae bacterium]|nr:ABC transporter ATP-binding protein [Anaerolineaceae bacterium]
MATKDTLTPQTSLPKTSVSLWPLLWRVYGYLRLYWKYAVVTYFSLLLVMAITTLVPQFIRWIIDTGIKGNQPNVLNWSVLALLGLTLIKGILNYFLGTFSEIASQNVAFDLRNLIQKKLTQLSFSFHDQSETGELLSRAVQDVERLRFLTGRATLRILEGVLTLVVTAVILLVMDFRLGLLVLVMMPLLVYQALHFGVRFRPLSLLIQKQLAILTTTVEQNLRGSRVVKAYAQEEAENELFQYENNRWFDLSARSAKMQAIQIPLLFLIANVSSVAIILYGGYSVINGQISLGVLIAFITYIGQLIEPVRRLGMIIPAVAIAGSSAERVFDILDTVSEVQDEPNAQYLTDLKGHVRFEHVVFYYGKRKILDGVDFEVKPGQIVALLGPTGSGKSTIVSLIPRFYDPSAGRILIDGLDIRHVTVQSLRRQIGIVLQETTLFATSIRENIAFGCEDVTQEKIEQAAKAAQAHEFILQTEKGYNTRVGERGVTLSGGQKQRLAIARALLMNPKILILDDATAAVDTETEHLIQLAMEKLIKGRTTFVIAHRLSTVRRADFILVIENGQIVAQGSHELLLQTSTQYVDIYNHQLKHQEEKL